MKALCSWCDTMVKAGDHSHDARVGLRFSKDDYDGYAICSLCREYSRYFRLQFFNQTGSFICEGCAVSHGVDLALWMAFRMGLWPDYRW